MCNASSQTADHLLNRCVTFFPQPNTKINRMAGAILKALIDNALMVLSSSRPPCNLINVLMENGFQSHGYRRGGYALAPWLW